MADFGFPAGRGVCSAVVTEQDSSETIKVFVSYSHDSEAHRERVLALADRLGADGLDVRLDRYVAHPPEGWPRWSQKQIIDAHFVLLVCTQTYRRRFEREETAGADKVVAWEALIADTVLYEANARNDKLIPVLFAEGTEADVQVSLRPYARYELSDEQGYEALYRRLTNQPETPAPRGSGSTRSVRGIGCPRRPSGSTSQGRARPRCTASATTRPNSASMETEPIERSSASIRRMLGTSKCF